MKRVVITGVGLITPIGCGKEEFYRSLQQGKHGIRPIEGFDTSDLEVSLSAPVREFDPGDYGIERKAARRMDRYCQFAVAAAHLAVKDAGGDFSDVDAFRKGVIVGSGIGGFDTTVAEIRKYLDKGPGRVSPFFIPMIISNMAAGMIAMDYGFKGDNFAPVTACATSAHAIGEAFRKIRHGYLDVCLAGGAESAMNKIALAGFSNMMALSKSTDPDRASIPFDRERNGFVMGEGAGIVVLEEYEHAVRRGAVIYAEIAGYGATADAYHITSPDPEGTGVMGAMRLAMEEAGLTAADINYINAHGTSTEINDRCETAAISKLFGGHAAKLCVNSTKSMTGHMLGATGAVECIVTALSLKNGFVHQTVGYQEKDPECWLDYVTEGPRSKDLRAALSNSLGFGGQNACLCLKKTQEA